MRPKLHANTTFIPVSDGIYFRSNRASLKLKGKNLASFFELLAPSLNGDSTLEEIVQGLSVEKKTLVTKFLEALLNFAFLKDISQDQAHTLTQMELATYASDIAFIDSFQSSAAARFASFRHKKLLVIGSGQSFTALVQACIRSGVQEITLIRTSESAPLSISQPDLLELFLPHDPAQHIHVIEAPRWDNEADVLNTILAYDALLHVSDRPMLARAQMLNSVCLAQKKTCIQAIIVDEHAWVGPLVSAETQGCWECAWRRLQTNITTIAAQDHDQAAFQDRITASVSEHFTSSAATMIASRLVFALLKHFTEAGQREESAGLVAMHLETLCSERHEFLPHPHCRSCQHPGVPTAPQFLKQIQRLQRQTPLDPATFCETMAHSVDGRLGLFTTCDTDDFIQMPLAVYKIGLSDPMFLNTSGEPLHVIEAGIERSSTRVRAWQRACERYAARLVDQRRLLSREAIQQQGAPILPVDRLLEVPVSLADSEIWSWALDLHTQQACLVPAPLLFTSLQPSAPGVGGERGIGSGMSWAEAICQALFDWGTFLALEQMRGAQQRYARVDLAHIPLTEEGAYLHRLLQSVGAQVTVYDVSGPLPIPTLAICLGAGVVAYSTHCDVAQALSIGLRLAMQQYQATHAQQPDYALPLVPDLPPTLRDDRWSEPVAYQSAPEAWPERQKWLLQQFQTQGMQAWASLLDHDPALTQRFPYIVRVLLARV
ncbi:MAG TPA: TOMM precursor leader peptide-binding protein [Ktedonobacteraceae bacterium]|nr:TOMM precursor leader peptide-binding protein [Ktedonobacteraceae bacterium]